MLWPYRTPHPQEIPNPFVGGVWLFSGTTQFMIPGRLLRSEQLLLTTHFIYLCPKRVKIQIMKLFNYLLNIFHASVVGVMLLGITFFSVQRIQVTTRSWARMSCTSLKRYVPALRGKCYQGLKKLYNNLQRVNSSNQFFQSLYRVQQKEVAAGISFTNKI